MNAGIANVIVCISQRSSFRGTRCFRSIVGIGLLLSVVCWPPSDLSRSVLADDSATTAIRSSAAKIDRTDLVRHVSTLASDSLEGRAAGSRGGHAAAAYLVTTLRQLDLAPAGTNGQWFQEFGQDYRNVLAIIPGRRSMARATGEIATEREVIVIGAHYDHIGYGTPQTSRGPLGQIHNGADDNASGTALLLELAEALTGCRDQLQRTYLLAFWDAEEIGLLGSQHWTANTDLRSVRLCINLDMVGRMQDNRIEVSGWRSAAGLRAAIRRANQDTRLEFNLPTAITNDSDHDSFFKRRVPVLFFETGRHADYHRPSDDANLLNYDGIQHLGQLLMTLIAELDATPGPLPAYRPESATQEVASVIRSDLLRPAPRLGMSWHPDRAAQGEVEVIQLIKGGPADLAGIRLGDRVEQFGDWTPRIPAAATIDPADGDRAPPIDFRTVVLQAKSDVAVRVSRRTGRGNEREVRELTVRLQGPPTLIGARFRDDAAQPGDVIVDQLVEWGPAYALGLRAGDVLCSMGAETDLTAARAAELWQSAPRPLVISWDRAGREYSGELR